MLDTGSIDSDLKLTEWTSCGGCAAKWGASPLSALVKSLAGSFDPSLLVGLAPFDDAAVYRVSDETALVLTTDFFPPLVDDPGDFGAIAAANACSDVFAMGGRVVLALNVAAFPERLPVDAVATILESAARVVEKAGGVIAGGHTIRSEEPVFGLAVQGLVHPDRVWAKGGARAGDVVLLSKPLGTGIVVAAGNAANVAAAIDSMRTLNRTAAEAIASMGEPPGAVTDVTGFGLLGHSWEVAERSNAVVELDASSLPLLPGALDAATAGVLTGGDARNREYLAGRISSSAPKAIEALAYDPQTSGGLLATVTTAMAPVLENAGFVAIGRVVAGAPEVRLA